MCKCDRVYVIYHVQICLNVCFKTNHKRHKGEESYRPRSWERVRVIHKCDINKLKHFDVMQA